MVHQEGSGEDGGAAQERGRGQCGCTGCRSGGECNLPVVSYHDALQSSDPATVLGAHALAMVATVVSADGGAWFRVDGRGRLRDAVAYDVVPWQWSPEAALRAYARRMRGLDPFAGYKHGPRAPVVTIADLGGPRMFSRSRFARTFLAPVGFPYVAMMNLVVGGRLGAQLWIGRSDGEDFDAAEANLMRKVHPLVQMALGHIPQRAALSVDRPDPLLTTREIEVAHVAATGATNVEIARHLHVSAETIKTHLRRIFSKLGIRTRTELARRMTGSAPRTPFG